jgi:YegS/Rv2252/BmrU family lipid kinase
MKKMLFIMNPYSGMRKANRYLTDIISLFNRADYEVNIRMTTGQGDAARFAEGYSAGVDLVVCCGGDGTLNETITGMIHAGSKAPIGYIPAGSTNDFATSLQLSADPLKAAQAILDGNAFRYDIGLFGQRHFCYVASFGAFTKTSYATPQSIKNALGHTAYVLSGIQELSQLRNTHMRVELDDTVIEDDFLFGAISNSTSVGGVLTLDPKQVDLQDGKFELLLIRTPRNLTELSECIQALQSQKYNCSAITFRSTSHLRVSSNEAVTWTLDGEREDVTGPVEVHNLHHAVSLLLRG